MAAECRGRSPGIGGNVSVKTSLICILGALVLASSPGLAGAQGLGLDLTDEGTTPDVPAPPPKPEIPDSPPDAPLSEAAGELVKEAPRGDVASAVGEQDVSLEDRVKAVQRKHFLKGGRLEVVPSFAMSLNDAFYSKVGGGVALNYHLADPIALSLHYDKFGIAQSDNVRIAKRELRSLLLSSKIDWTAGIDVVWTPIYGKLAWFNNIVSYDFFLMTGVGGAWSQTSGDPVGDGLHPAADAGIGQRFSLADWMAFEFWVKQLLYADRPQDREISEIQKVLTVNVGLSFWIPPSFDYEVQ